ncbi:flagellin [Dissulfurispira thermophila]|uniref:Flagellin n=1 Tax=Dissulfurispira thermophila TaxID=2715679 RepID=A0A7G1H2A1_9BACT|nr:flagellin [Dissulfurispira thermophila]BCB96086.1 flagellin [Dissulfurispira thermophila]
MALSINTNLFALNAQRNLRKSETPLATAMQRLSSTLRINSAKDDAAGLAIATRMTTQINGLSVAMRNANDGVSFSQTAEGAMDEMINALQRIYELANQASSYNTSADRSSLNQEVRQLVSELNRIVTQTKYNGEQFLNQAKSINIQVGVDVNETINISTASVTPTSMGVATSYSQSLTGADVANAARVAYENTVGLGANATLEGIDLGDAITTPSDYRNNSINIINRINQYTSQTGVTAFSFGNALVGSAAIVGGTTGLVVDSGYITINGVAIGSFTISSTASNMHANIANAINAKTATTGVTAYIASSIGGSDGRLILVNTTGAGIDVSIDTNAANASQISTHPFDSGTTSVSAGQNGKIIFNATLTKTSLSFDSSDTGAVFGVGSQNTSVSLTANSVNAVSVTDVGLANVTMLAAKQALDTITAEKAKLGAIQNRLASTIANLDNVRENITAARSRIMDADFAVETANLTKALIMQQAGISVLSQANTLPQNVLALLGGR